MKPAKVSAPPDATATAKRMSGAAENHRTRSRGTQKVKQARGFEAR
jgi:hypothetical protein